MMLKALYDYYQRCDDVAPEGMEFKEIGFLIVIDKEGTFLRIEDSRIDKKQCKQFLVPKTIKRSGKKAGKSPCIMWDNTHFLIGTPKGDKPNPDGQYLDAFKAMVKDLSKKHPANIPFDAINKFYEQYEGKDLSYVFFSDELCDDLLGTDKNISFRIEGATNIVAEEHDLRNELKEESSNENKWETCLITGKRGEIARIHSKTPLPGFTFSSLVSFQKNSGFDSYGKEQAYNAPISKEAEFAYTTALNTMLARDSHNKFSIGGRTYLFWASSNDEACQQTEESVFSLFGFQEKSEDDPNRNIMKVREVFKGIFSGQIKTTLDDKFYILGLAPNSARIAVVYWSETTLKEFAGMLLKHFDDMEINSPKYDKPFAGLYHMMLSVSLRSDMKNCPPNLPDDVIKSIFQGTPYPYTLFSSVIRRIRAEGQITPKEKILNSPCRVAILKAYLNRLNDNNNKKIQIMLDKENTNQGYLCGRLFAVMENLQYAANKQDSIRSSYMNAASSTPSTVFSTILKLSNTHYGKLTKENKGLAIYFDRQKEDILSMLGDFPDTLELKDQGRFFLGYYHQKNFKENKENEV